MWDVICVMRPSLQHRTYLVWIIQLRADSGMVDASSHVIDKPAAAAPVKKHLMYYPSLSTEQALSGTGLVSPAWHSLI